MKSKTKDEKQLPIVYDKVNSNNLRRFEPRQMEKFVAKQPDTSVSISSYIVLLRSLDLQELCYTLYDPEALASKDRF